MPAVALGRMAATVGAMPSWEPGRTTIEYLLGRGRLEHIDGTGAVAASAMILERAGKRLLTAAAGLEAGDADGAFVAAYDAYRMSAEALLIRQGFRATGGDGSHVSVEDAVGAQFSSEVAAFAKPTFERFRRTRHAAQYFDPSVAELTDDDARWALDTAGAAVDGARRLIASNPPPLFD